MTNKLHHIGVIVENIEQALIPYEKGLGLKPTEIIYVESYDCRIALLPMGDISIELIQPLGTTGELVDFLRSGGGLHHIAVEVEEVEEVIHDLQNKGIEMKDTTPRLGAHDARIAFAKKESFQGTIVEYIEPRKDKLYKGEGE